MTTLISGCVMILSGIVFLVSILVSSGPQYPKVGDVFAHVNPGTSNDPDEPDRPFVRLYTVVEIKGDKCKIFGRYLHLDGKVVTGDNWDSAFGLGQHDTKLSK